MVNVKIKLSIKKINWESGNFEEEREFLKEYIVTTKQFSVVTIDSIFTRMLQIKGDYISSEYNIIDGFVDVSYELIFNSISLSSMDKDIINKIISYIDNYVESLPKIDDAQSVILNEIEERGVFIEFPAKYDIVQEVLKDKNIKFDVINKNGTRYEGGCGSGFDNIIIFVSEAIKSGVTWDVIKLMIQDKLPNIDMEDFNVQIFDNIKFKRLRKVVADRIREDVEKIRVIRIDKESDDQKIDVEFKCKRRNISVICDKNYNIIKLNCY